MENKKQPFFSVIVSCYNASPYIARLLDSLVGQDDDMEIVICDDRSTDNFMEIVDTYADRLHITKCVQDLSEFHCPGNTRQAGLNHASGKWIIFSDQDDFFEPNAFAEVRKLLTDDVYVLSTSFQVYNPETKSIDKKMDALECSDTWTHGKWFRKSFVDENKCGYQLDLESHEDLYFNASVVCKLISKKLDYTYARDLITYNWVSHPDSLSKKDFSEKHYYIDKHLNDYLISATEEYIENAYLCDSEEWIGWCFNQAVMGLLHGYFYHQGDLYRNRSDYYDANHRHLNILMKKIMRKFRCTEFNIIAYVYGNPDVYDRCKAGCYPGCGKFVETQSFRDFILNL